MTLALLNSLAGTSTGGSTLLTGLVATEEKVVAQCKIPAGMLRDNGSLTLKFSGLNTTATAENTFSLQAYHDSVPAVITAGASSGTAIFTMPETITFEDAAWDESSQTITLTGAFAGYTLVPGDTATVTAGLATVDTPSRILLDTNDVITLADDLNAAGGDEANGVDGFVTQGTLPSFTWTPGALDAWRVELQMSVNRMATTSCNFALQGTCWVNPAVSNGTSSETITTTATVATVTTGNYTDATRTITQTDAFAAYTFQAGDVFVATAGTGVTPGSYVVASRVNKDSITVETDINGGGGDIADNTVAGTITRSVTSASQTRQDIVKGGTIAPNSASLIADQYLWFTIKSSVSAAAFTVTHTEIWINGKSQGLFATGN